jgi:adenylate kinase family enzyme
VAAISGRTRAGKTTLARALSATLGWPESSFSAWIRAEARRGGLREERRVLQDLGAELLGELGPQTFCHQMLQHAGLETADAPFIIEGIRHLDTLDGLRQLLEPAQVVSIHLDVSDEERLRRLAREGVGPREAARWEEHSTEFEVLKGLPQAADLVVDADRPAAHVANTVIAWLKQHEDRPFRPPRR